jgi:O-antigen/teichoic acid export membrane protein
MTSHRGYLTWFLPCHAQQGFVVSSEPPNTDPGTTLGGSVKFNLKSNAIWALAEVCISALNVFLIYRIVISSLGISAVGVWALVTATVALARFADIGAAAGLTRFVALSLERGHIAKARTYIGTGAIANVAIFSIGAALLFYPGFMLLSSGLDERQLLIARQLYPVAVASIPLVVLSATLLAGLVGIHRADLKSKFTCVGQITYVVVVLSAISKAGLMAVALGQIAQALVIISLSVLTIKRRTHSSRRGPLWSFMALREMIGLGFRVQAAGVLSLTVDPLSKYLMAVFGGIDAVGLYDMAQKLVLQARQLVNGPIQVLVPAFAGTAERGASQLRHLYMQSFSLSILLGIPVMLFAVCVAPIASMIWLSKVDWLFLKFTALLAGAWTLSLFAAPGYLLATGVGRLKWNILGNLAVALLTVALGALFGNAAGAVGVAAGSTLALAIGNIVILAGNSGLVSAPVIPRWIAFRSAIASLTPMRDLIAPVWRRK